MISLGQFPEIGLVGQIIQKNPKENKTTPCGFCFAFEGSYNKHLTFHHGTPSYCCGYNVLYFYWLKIVKKKKKVFSNFAHF